MAKQNKRNNFIFMILSTIQLVTGLSVARPVVVTDNAARNMTMYFIIFVTFKQVFDSPNLTRSRMSLSCYQNYNITTHND